MFAQWVRSESGEVKKLETASASEVEDEQESIVWPNPILCTAHANGHDEKDVIFLFPF